MKDAKYGNLQRRTGETPQQRETPTDKRRQEMMKKIGMAVVLATMLATSAEAGSCKENAKGAARASEKAKASCEGGDFDGAVAAMKLTNQRVEALNRAGCSGRLGTVMAIEAQMQQVAVNYLNTVKCAQRRGWMSRLIQ